MKFGIAKKGKQKGAVHLSNASDEVKKLMTEFRVAKAGQSGQESCSPQPEPSSLDRSVRKT